MINFFYNKTIFFTTLIISILNVFFFSIQNEKFNYTLVLTPKIYNFNDQIYTCSDPTDIMFASYYAIQTYFENDEYPEEAKFTNSNRLWIKSYGMQFILIKKKFSIFPLTNGAIEIIIFDNKKVDQKMLIENIDKILKNLKNGNYFQSHLNITTSLNIEKPDYKILFKDEIDACKEFINIVFEKHKKIENNFVYKFLLLFLSLYIFIFSIYKVKKSRIFS